MSAAQIIRNLKKSETAHSSAIKDSAQTVVEEARTIKALVDEFSNFARMPSLSLQPTDVHALIRQTIALFRDIFNDVEIETQFSSTVPDEIKVDPEQMKRVFINLMDNAIDAMKKKGEILFRTSFDQDQQVLTIEIADSGPGINLKNKDKLFLPHFSTKKKGTGLGLAIVNQVIEEHNGSIDVESTQPQGAKFTIKIPA